MEPTDGGDISGILRSEYEQLLAPDRGELITATAVPHPNDQAQQGTVATQNDKPVIAGVNPNAIAFYRWW